MTIQLEYLDNSLLLKVDKKLPNSIKFQIEFYGFMYNKEDQNIFINSSIDFDLSELIEFLNNNKIEFNLCNETKKILEKQTKKLNDFKVKIDSLIETKENIDEDNFKEFCKSVDYLNRPLKLHQENSLYHVDKANCAANFSVPGSGKTSVVLAFYEKLKLKNQ